jgi:hypothetical protein
MTWIRRVSFILKWLCRVHFGFSFACPSIVSLKNFLDVCNIVAARQRSTYQLSHRKGASHSHLSAHS